ncbi:MAG: hypothetical protein KJ732_00095, partial [Candidatus Margulisbacteria bacterium]|nr:hypothetical protein [Candidatus Margulisiibacteriota bacterium]
ERGRFKVVRFWRTVAEKDRGAPPFAFRLVTFRGPTGDWRIFWAQLDDFHALKQLIFKDELGPDELIKELTAMAREYPAVFPEAISDWSRQDWIRQLNNALPSPRERAKMTAALQRYLFSTANGKTFPATWRAYHMRHPDGFVQSEARRKILGELLILPLPLRFPLGEIPSLSREYGGRFKWIDFWLSPESCKTGARPFATRFIGFKPAGERWQLFWRQLDDWKAFRQLVWDGKITVDELENILTEISYDRTEILPLLDKLYFSENIFSRRKKC